MHTSPSDSNNLGPLSIGNFDLEAGSDGRPRLLGKGTFGETYLARHRFLETTVAIKFITGRFTANPQVRDRFLAEAKAVAKLKHSGIAQVYDFGPTANGLFYAMEFCAGGNLAEWMQRHGPMPVEQLIAVGQQVSSALKCCHAAGFVHRDLKPANIMLAHASGELETKLIDFGLALAEPTGPDQQTDNHCIGTPLYASPEQIEEKEVDGRSDIFSLGMTLWHLATGVPPDRGKPIEIIVSRLNPVSYEECLPNNLPAGLRSILERLVEKPRNQRPSGAAEVLDLFNELAGCLNLPVLVPPAPTAERAPTGDARPFDIQQMSRELAEDFQVAAFLGRSPGLRNYQSRPVHSGSRPALLGLLDLEVIGNQTLLNRIRSNAAEFKKLKIRGVLDLNTISAYSDQTALCFEAPQGTDLLTTLKSRGKIPLTDAKSFLEAAANASDLATMAGLPGIVLDPAQIFIFEGGAAVGGRWQSTFLPRLLTDTEWEPHGEQSIQDMEDASATMAPSLLRSSSSHTPAHQVARLLFRVVAGRDVPLVASLSTSGYVAVPELSEETNRILSQVIAGDTSFTSSLDMLVQLLELEGVSANSTSSKRGSVRSGMPSHGAGAASQGAASVASAARASGEFAPSRTAEPRMAPIPPLTADTLSLPLKSSAESASPAHTQVTSPLLGRYGFWAAIVLMVGIALSVYGIRSRVQKTHAAADAPSVVLQPALQGERIEAKTLINVTGDGLYAVNFSIGTTTLPAHRSADGWELTVPTDIALPAELVIEAVGYFPQKLRINHPKDLSKSLSYFPKRLSGKVVFEHKGPVDYREIGVKMVGLLAEEEGRVPLNKGNRGLPIKNQNEPSVWELDTGVYMLSLQGSQSTVSERRWKEDIKVKAGSETRFTLPLSWAGSYSATLRDSSGTSLICKFTIEPEFATTTFECLTKGTEFQTVFDNFKLDSKGNLSGRVRRSVPVEGNRSFDWSVGAVRDDSGSIKLTIEEKHEPNRALEVELKRSPYDSKQWQARGEAQLTN